jgi:hypothetical protein
MPEAAPLASAGGVFAPVCPLVPRWFVGLLYPIVGHRCTRLELPTMLTLPQATALGLLEHALMRIVWAHGVPMTVKRVAQRSALIATWPIPRW